MVLSALAALMLIVVAIPTSVARAADDTESPPESKTEYKPQAEDADRPHDKSLLEKTPADAAVASKAQQSDEAFYQRWQFWAISGAILVGAAAAIWGGITLYHTVHGGDVRPCNTAAFIGCYGQGESQ